MSGTYCRAIICQNGPLSMRQLMNCYSDPNYFMKQICRNCHFFAKESTHGHSGNNPIFSVEQDERESAKHNDFSFIKDYQTIKCRMGVWDEGLNPNKNGRDERINLLVRKGKCFFFPYDPNMLFPAAIELQKRQKEYEQVRKSNRYTVIGLWIAALALLANAIIGIIQLICNN